MVVPPQPHPYPYRSDDLSSSFFACQLLPGTRGPFAFSLGEDLFLVGGGACQTSKV